MLRSMNAFAILRAVHIALGVVALATMFVPMFSRKGSSLHVKIGRVYTVAMGAVAATGAPLAVHSVLDPDPGRRASGLFLFFIALLAADNAWMGVRALRTKHREGPNTRPLDLLPPIALLAGAVVVLALGVSRGVVLHIVFGMLGLSIGTSQLSFWRRAPKGPADSILRHIGAMGVSCIVTLTAFVVTNARYLGAALYNPVVWITPAVVGAVAISRAQRRWRARLAATGAASTADPGEATGGRVRERVVSGGRRPAPRRSGAPSSAA
jgi:hypothetical protein